MNSALGLSAILIGLMTTACTGSGFMATLKDGIDVQTDSHPRNGNGNGADPTTVAKAGAPGAGSITLGGILISENGNQTQLNPQLKVEQTALRPQASDLRHLDQIENNSTFVQIGCNPSVPNVANLIKGLSESRITTDDLAETIAIKAKVVVICGKNNLPQPYVTIVADQLALMDAHLEISTTTGAGFFAAYVNKLSLAGSSQIIGKISDPGNIGLNAPSLTLIAQQSTEGQGTLELKTVGEKQTAIVKK